MEGWVGLVSLTTKVPRVERETAWVLDRGTDCFSTGQSDFRLTSQVSFSAVSEIDQRKPAPTMFLFFNGIMKPRVLIFLMHTVFVFPPACRWLLPELLVRALLISQQLWASELVSTWKRHGEIHAVSCLLQEKGVRWMGESSVLASWVNRRTMMMGMSTVCMSMCVICSYVGMEPAG